jgi:hypothetical protein
MTFRRKVTVIAENAPEPAFGVIVAAARGAGFDATARPDSGELPNWFAGCSAAMPPPEHAVHEITATRAGILQRARVVPNMIESSPMRTPGISIEPAPEGETTEIAGSNSTSRKTFSERMVNRPLAKRRTAPLGPFGEPCE